MLKQDVEIIFPKLQLKTFNESNDVILDALAVNTSYIQDIRNEAEDAVRAFVTRVRNNLQREVYEPIRKTFKLREIELWTEYEQVFTANPWTVSSTHYLSENFNDHITSLLFVSIFTIIKDVLKKEPVTIKLTEEETEVQVTLIYEGNYKWNLPLTAVQLKQEQGKAIKIRYGNHLHTALWLICEYGKDVVKDGKVSIETAISLAQLELIDPTHQFIVDKGQQVLAALEQFNPAEQPDLVSHFSAALLEPWNDTPTHLFAKDNGYLEQKKGTVSGTYTAVSDRGKLWLTEHSKAILSKSSCTKAKRKALIPYTPIEFLSPFLTSDDEAERKEASKRMDELMTEEENT